MGNSSRWVPFPRFDFSGGINTRFSEIGLEENEVVDMYNMHITPRGGVSKRKGSHPVPSFEAVDSTAINGIYHFETEDVSLILRTKGGNIEYLQSYGWVDVTNGHTISSSADVLMVWDTFRNHAVLTDGVNPLLKWDGDASGAGFAALGNAIDGGSDTIDSAKAVVKHRERLVLGNVKLTESSTQTHYESRIISSDTGTLESWDSGKSGWSLDIGKGDGHHITALVDIDGILVVFKNGSLWKVTNLGREGIQNTEFIAEVGTPGPHTVKAVGTIVFFLDQQGHLWAFNTKGVDESSLQNLSVGKIGPTVIDQIVKSRLPQSSMYYDPYWAEIVYGVTMPENETETTTWWSFNLLTQGLARLEYPNYNLNLCVSVKDKDDVTRAVGGGYDGRVYQLEWGQTDDGNNIEGFTITRADDFGDLSVEKILGQIIVWARTIEAKSFKIESRTDFSKTGIEYEEEITPPGDDYSGDPDWGTPSGDTSTNDPITSVADEEEEEPPTVPDSDETVTELDSTDHGSTYTGWSWPYTDGAFVYQCARTGGGSGGTVHVLKIDPTDNSFVLDYAMTSLGTGQFSFDTVGYDSDNDRLWGTRDNEIFVIDMSDGSVLQTLDFTTDVSPFNDSTPGDVIFSGDNIYLPYRASGFSSPADMAVYNKNTYAFVETIHMGGIPGKGGAEKVGSNYYMIDGSEAIRSPLSGQVTTASSDHGNLQLDGTFGNGTSADLRRGLIYLSSTGMLYGYGDSNAGADNGGLYIIDPVLRTCPTSHHDPGEDYFASTEGPNDAIKDELTGFNNLSQMWRHGNRQKLYIWWLDGTDLNLDIGTPGTRSHTFTSEQSLVAYAGVSAGTPHIRYVEDRKLIWTELSGDMRTYT